ncbi:uncharacterized protein LOC100165173 [Acyrthosiphon pisum]|uniref:CDAN1-interacting nuclease 1 n=2 Tax=Acyrthosiphon pisum TaxID=7029 RepID=A0A8R2BB48_ACYPI|nr:uncharacterized protein LOC100165173 [Acyrthosiphon pisum]|eukprot:XP_008189348.1 PREDICTED: uncharacterized protein LOC100165173 [Acyrthosiphon pisum]
MDATIDSNFHESKRKCITKSEYNAMVDWVDSSIKNNHDFILNRYGVLTSNALIRYPHLHKNTVISIVDGRVQQYVRQRHHKVFSSTSNANSPLHSSATKSKLYTNYRQQERINKHLTGSSKTMNERYKELVANGTVSSPLITLADKLRMPAMLVAKFVLTDQIKEEKLKEKLDQQHSINDDSLNSSILNDTSVGSTASNLQNDSERELKQDLSANDSTAKELDTSYSIDEQLSKQLNWLTCKLRSMHKSELALNQSDNSLNNSNSYCIPTTDKSLTPHQLAMSTWLIRKDPQLAYEVYKSSVVDGHYGSCVEFIKSCNGKRFEQILKQNMTGLTKSRTNKPERNYTTEKECRLRGLDMTPDVVLNEPIAIILSDVHNMKYSQEYTATNYVGGSENEIRVLNWIESKAMFGGPDQLRKSTQGQLFPYWNRYGPGAVIYWFGHILEDNDKVYGVHAGVSLNKNPIDNISTSVTSPSKNDLAELSAFNFWSKYCLLMDGFPATNKIVMHNRQNGLKKKNSTTVSMTV